VGGNVAGKLGAGTEVHGGALNDGDRELSRRALEAKAEGRGCICCLGKYRAASSSSMSYST
jgi:acetyl esterase/lipase